MAILVKTMRVIPEPENMGFGILDYRGEPPFIKGGGFDPRAWDSKCGGCGVVLIENVSSVMPMFKNAILRCPKCGSFNVID